MTAARARSADPDTSHAAAASLAPDKIRLSQHAVLRHLRRNGPMTDTELVDTFDGKIFQSPSGLRTRRKELVDRGLVADTGERVRLESGRTAIIWSAVRH